MVFLRPTSNVPRSCFVQTSENEVEREARPLADFRCVPAYVLLGDPGAGKTTAFREEQEALGDRAEFLTARHFLRVDLSFHSDWKDKVLFIDGLDEVRAGQSDARSAINTIDNVISRLDSLGKPSFPTFLQGGGLAGVERPFKSAHCLTRKRSQGASPYAINS